jgi:PAS domain S-box-containing protein
MAAERFALGEGHHLVPWIVPLNTKAVMLLVDDSKGSAPETEAYEHGGSAGTLDLAQAITARKEVEHELRELNRTLEERVVERSEALMASERRYHDTLDKMMEGVQLIDPEWRYVYVNEALVAQSSYRREELIGHTMMEMYPGIEGTELFAVLQECKADRVARTLDNDFVFPNGRKGTFQLSIQPMSHGIFILSTDITKNKKAEEALRASEARFHNALDVLIEGAQIIGHDWRHLYVNNAFVVQSSFTKDQLLGTTVMDRYPGVEGTDVFKELQRCMRDRCTHIMETGFTFPNGVSKHFYLSIQPVEEGIFVLSKDITDRKRVELELAEQRRQLKEQNRELEQFTYIASHDLQEPLRMVSSYVQLLQRRYGDELDTDAHEFIAYAIDGAQRMKQLIDDLLTYSRFGLIAELETVDMNEIVAQTLANLDRAISESGATVHVDVLPRVTASTTDMLQIMQNLIGNALKFRREGTVPEIRVKGSHEGTRWHFEVIDNGIGIEPAYHETIFTPFKRLNDRSRYVGSGIGLAIAQKIVQRYGGRIWVTSGSEGGSNFQFTLEHNRP